MQDRPVLSSFLIAILAGLLLQAAYLFDLSDLVEGGFRMAMGAVLVFVAVPLLLGYYRAGWFDEYRSRLRLSMGPQPTRTVVAGILSFVALIVVLMVSSRMAGIFRFDPSALIDDGNWVILWLALTPGIWEELAFRGVVLSNLGERFSRWRAVTISSVAFGIYHFSNLWAWDDPVTVVFGVILATAVGMGWGYLAISTNSIVPTMVLHYAMDVILYDQIFVVPWASAESTGKIYLALGTLYPIVTILLTRLVFKNTRPADVHAPAGR